MSNLDNFSTIHPHTRQLLTSLSEVPQALIISGIAGVGKTYVAENWLKTLKVTSQQIFHILPEKQTISIHQIRELYNTTRTKRQQQHFFIINSAETMSSGAQNAFLKLLEEPNEPIHFILLTNQVNRLLPTIHSRSHIIEVLPLPKKILQTFLENKFQLKAEKLQQILFIADGLPGHAVQLADDPANFDANHNIITEAKSFISSPVFQRLQIVGTIGNDRQHALQLVDSVLSISSILLKSATTSSSQHKWIKNSLAAHTVAERLTANGNCKAQLTYLATIL